MNKLNTCQTKSIFLHICDRIIEGKDYLTEIDSRIGDGDHGIGMALGFDAVRKLLEDKEFETVNEIFNSVGMCLLKTMGGASGVIFGTLFFAGVKGLQEIRELDLQSISLIFGNSLDAIKKRGNASVGDKTMVDALEPAVRELRKSASAGDEISAGLQKAVKAAKDGMESTKGFAARFGKAKTLGERTIGYPDAGAVSVTIIFKAILDWVEINESNS